ncbi:hypothetical protein [Chryseobacterium salivictor]|uniref:Uncharacterized protein n=1 Tax=Chryseobacterium salivictor TaxID=2547600 RepID=A0A4P6ZFL5_9FLAO|nr:hypothetical protein [Chryseobacterium salivictor]QBO58401.1 hypothetical protein NBC122_01586 [Chryseobacterium salivictor]
MDNHMAASWCWSKKIDVNEKYNFFHIDRHYDLLNGSVSDWVGKLRELNFNIVNSTIEEYVNAHYMDNRFNKKTKIFRYDNYITIFAKLFPNLINEKKFATHEDGTVPEDWQQMYQVPFYDLHTNLAYWINETKENWIVNIDLDYFFCDDNNGIRYQIFTDEYIKNIGKEIFKCLGKITVITIALSPSFCNGIDNSKRIANLLLDEITTDNWVI